MTLSASTKPPEHRHLIQFKRFQGICGCYPPQQVEFVEAATVTQVAQYVCFFVASAGLVWERYSEFMLKYSYEEAKFEAKKAHPCCMLHWRWYGESDHQHLQVSSARRTFFKPPCLRHCYSVVLVILQILKRVVSSDKNDRDRDDNSSYRQGGSNWGVLRVGSASARSSH